MPDTIHILLVDDEPRNLDALESILDDPSYRLLRADNADLALKLLLERDVAAIVLDIKMPGVSGLELAQLIKGTRKFRQIPIVFLTAYLVDDKDVLTGYGAGAVDYLTKPVNPFVLRQKVAVFADLFRKTHALAELNAQLEARVRERTAELEHASRMKDEFLATLSHELRTPLNAMLGWATILMQDGSDPDQLRRGLEVIERNARAQERLIADLLDASRIISGKLRLKITRFPLSKAILAAADVVRPTAEVKGIRLVLELDPDIEMILADPERLQQVLWNLITNAIRYTPSGGRVTVTAKREGSIHVVRVEDTGAGIAAEHLPRLFERFHQVDSSTTRAHGGLGLGLALVRHLVEAHGGTVEAKSDGRGRGASFSILLPLVAADTSASASATEAEMETERKTTETTSGWRAGLANVRVLVVDDDPDSLDLVRVILEDAGASVMVTSSATEALNAIEAQAAFQVIVSDVGMPGMDGYTLMERVRAAARGQPIPSIALTAYAREVDIRHAKQAGYQEHLSKPVDAQKLIDTVRALTAQAEPAQNSSAPQPSLT